MNIMKRSKNTLGSVALSFVFTQGSTYLHLLEPSRSVGLF